MVFIKQSWLSHRTVSEKTSGGIVTFAAATLDKVDFGLHNRALTRGILRCSDTRPVGFRLAFSAQPVRSFDGFSTTVISA